MPEKRLCTLKNMNFIIEVATPPILCDKPHVWSFVITENKNKVLYKIVTNRKRKNVYIRPLIPCTLCDPKFHLRSHVCLSVVIFYKLLKCVLIPKPQIHI